MNEEKNSPRIALVVPCFNESEVLVVTTSRLIHLLDEMIRNGEIHEKSYIVYVDDGSSDSTWNLLLAVASQNSGRIIGIRLACNAGHQKALLCGLEYVTNACDAAVSLDADLQDDLHAVPKMVERFANGAELVLGVRESREVDTWFKRTSALGFYKAMRFLGVDLVENHADFRLMSSRVLINLNQFSESNLFLRGLMPLLHNKVEVVTYNRGERLAGETKYPLRRMLSLAWNGVTSFSAIPLRMISAIGSLVFFASLGMVAYALLSWWSGRTLPGWTSVVIPLYLLGGLIMLCIGVVGEYVSKLFMEVKRRPRYLIDAITGETDSNEN